MHDSGIRYFICAILKKSVLVYAFFLIGVVWMFAPSAHACSCRLTRDWGFIGPKIGRLPANAVGVAWHKPWLPKNLEPNEVLNTRFRVEIHENRKFRSLPVKVRPVEGFSGIYVIAPEGESLKLGATYRLQSTG